MVMYLSLLEWRLSCSTWARALLQGTEAFCSGGDQAVRGIHGYVGDDNIGRLNILDVQVLVRFSCMLQVLVTITAGTSHYESLFSSNLDSGYLGVLRACKPLCA